MRGIVFFDQMIPKKAESAQRRKGKLVVLKLKKDSFLTTQDVARWLGSSPRTVTELVQRWHDTGGQEGIPGFKVGRAWRFEAERLEAWVADQQQPKNSAPGSSPTQKTTAVA